MMSKLNEKQMHNKLIKPLPSNEKCHKMNEKIPFKASFEKELKMKAHVDAFETLSILPIVNVGSNKILLFKTSSRGRICSLVKELSLSKGRGSR